MIFFVIYAWFDVVICLFMQLILLCLFLMSPIFLFFFSVDIVLVWFHFNCFFHLFLCVWFSVCGWLMLRLMLLRLLQVFLSLWLCLFYCRQYFWLYWCCFSLLFCCVFRFFFIGSVSLVDTFHWSLFSLCLFHLLLLVLSGCLKNVVFYTFMYLMLSLYFDGWYFVVFTYLSMFA